jgi:hypothetical protein
MEIAIKFESVRLKLSPSKSSIEHMNSNYSPSQEDYKHDEMHIDTSSHIHRS